MQVLKFGGSSVANAENINKVVEIIKNKKTDGKNNRGCIGIGRHNGYVA